MEAGLVSFMLFLIGYSLSIFYASLKGE